MLKMQTQCNRVMQEKKDVFNIQKVKLHVLQDFQSLQQSLNLFKQLTTLSVLQLRRL